MIRFRFFFYAFSLALVASSSAVLAAWGLPLGIDFTGGSLLEVNFVGTNPTQEREQANLTEAFSRFSIQPQVQNVDDDALVLRFREMGEDDHRALISELKEKNPTLREQRFESIGPTIGQETRDKSVVAMALVIGTILVYVAWAFRKLSHPLASWQYGLVTVVTLVHDVIVTVGFVVVLTHVTGRDAGVPFVAALLTVLGYSVNDTIVVFDRIRENLSRATAKVDFSELVNRSLRETFVRSLNASLTTILVLLAVLVMGGETVFVFLATLVGGIAIGTYSSLFLASPLVVDWAKKSKK
jgi:preprotein translocase subunit SecF